MEKAATVEPDPLTGVGEERPSVMLTWAVPSPAAQICPERGWPEGNLAEQGSQLGRVWMSVMVAAWGATTVMSVDALTVLPALSKPTTSRWWAPGSIQWRPWTGL